MIVIPALAFVAVVFIAHFTVPLILKWEARHTCRLLGHDYRTSNNYEHFYECTRCGDHSRYA